MEYLQCKIVCQNLIVQHTRSSSFIRAGHGIRIQYVLHHKEVYENEETGHLSLKLSKKLLSAIIYCTEFACHSCEIDVVASVIVHMQKYGTRDEAGLW